MSFIAGSIIIASSVALAAGGTTAVLAGSQARKQKKQEEKYANQLRELESNRQEIINPADAVKDMSSQIQNPYANLQVATQAAEMQATQADISLANTLDQLRATGAGAGGATALARAAAQSKREVSASIESQEAANARLRATGEQQRQQMVLGEQARVQAAQMAGAQYAFGAQEQREMMQLDRVAAQQQNAAFLRAQYQQQMMGAISSTAGNVASFAAGYGSGPSA
jgi:hypothetical protein